MARILLLLIGLLHLNTTSAAATDWIIVPGERVGSITSNTSEEDLVKIFGAKNIERTSVAVGEGDALPGTVLFPDDATKTLFVLWHDDLTRKSPKSILIRNQGTKWKTEKGITIGTSLKTLQKLNHGPFVLLGFSWDYSGTVVDCVAGNLKELCSKANAERALTIRLAPDNKLQGSADYTTVKGEREFSSDIAAMQRLNPRIYELINNFAGPTPYAVPREMTELTLSLSSVEILKELDSVSFVKAVQGSGVRYFQQGEVVGVRLVFGPDSLLSKFGLESGDVVLDIGKDPTVLWKEARFELFLTRFLFELLHEARAHDAVRVHLLRMKK